MTLLLEHTLGVAVIFFFFSSRRRHTRSKRDWSSDVCSSDLGMVLVDAMSEKVRNGLTPEQWKFYVNFGFTKPTPGFEKYKDIETLDVNASLDQIGKAAVAEPFRPMPVFVLMQGQPFDLSPWQPLP